ncbi:MFS general substrate transporter [Dichomitus squalens LYAD-421 SS1]|uniref:MFS general substrate transporter n=1 Tax=Dichomitus squalens (strain LYAD-421) TaxID=732165 RepID=UPI0004411924|nr:MFS general substrate transporter [Dichomitus squalens LYAD-421 SS1]EJF62434.1 MFS general substrate transporter [Dichomitus squalens LYAD-421 SS1]
MATSVPMSQATTLHATDEEAVLRLPHDVERGAPDGTERGGPAGKSLKFASASEYPGSGTREDPYRVDWDIGDADNPFNWSKTRKWMITGQLALSTFTVSFCSSCYSGGLASMSAELHISQTIAILGVSLYVLGFGLGPLVFAPLGELYGRRIVFVLTASVFMLFHLGGALGHNAATILSTRLLAGIFGSAPLTNAGGALSDMWIARERGFATSLYGTAPWMGPVLGPIVGGWVSQSRLGWRFSFWIMFIVSALNALSYYFLTPETFGPVLLRRRARRLTKASGRAVLFVSRFDINRSVSLSAVLKRDMGRPFYFLFTEPIVLLLAIYIAIAYATLYAFFAAYPIVFQERRGFSEGEGGLAFLGIGVGNLLGISLAPIQNKLYWRAMDRNDGRTVPEARLYLPMVGGIFLPISLFWFAWTSDPPIPWIVPVLAGIPFGFSCAIIMQGLTQYLMDAYSIYCASAIASTVILRSVVAAIFPLISPALYHNLGDAWACSVFAFLASACMPVPFLFYKYGAWVRSKSKWALRDNVPIHTEPPSRADFDDKKVPEASEKAVV